MLLLILAIGCYALFAWAAVFKFKPDDESSKAFKRFIRPVGIICIIYFLFLIATSPKDAAYSGASAFLFLAAMALFVWSIQQFHLKNIGFAGSSAIPDNVINSGPYKLFNHPIYVSYSIGWLAGAIHADNQIEAGIAATLIAAIVAAYYFAAKKEDEALGRV